MPGIYVVTSTLFVSLTRATLRSAEFGFFGVCVYTRMHTPRFCGLLSSAGDFVFDRICSRPARTNWPNVGTALPQSSKNLFGLRSQHAQVREVLDRKGHKRLRRNRQETPHRYQLRRSPNWPHRRGLLGFAGLAPHSGRSPHPIPSFFVPGLGDLPFHQHGQNSPDKTLIIGENSFAVKRKRAAGQWKSVRFMFVEAGGMRHTCAMHGDSVTPIGYKMFILCLLQESAQRGWA